VALSAAVAAAGGEVREIKAPKEGQMVRWIEERAAERGVRFGRGAAQELATRVGAFVREGDVDRRRQGRLAVSELDKLGLYRPVDEVSVENVRTLVPEAIPGSIWGLLDALAERRTAAATELAERLVATTPPPVLLAVIHRRIRELIQVADLVAGGATAPEIVRTLKLKPYPAEKLVKQSRAWPIEELELALSGLLELDVAIKGSNGQAVSEAQVQLALMLWIAEHVARPAVGSGRT
jgi:DNA polymerase III delta subunit